MTSKQETEIAEAIRGALHDCLIKPLPDEDGIEPANPTVYIIDGRLDVTAIARAAIAAHTRALEAAGMICVPIEPTEAMSKAGFLANVHKNYHNGEPGCPGVVCPVEPPKDWLNPDNAVAVQAYLDAPKCLIARLMMPAEPAWRAMVSAYRAARTEDGR